jgi:hypothetical protein
VAVDVEIGASVAVAVAGAVTVVGTIVAAVTVPGAPVVALVREGIGSDPAAVAGCSTLFADMSLITASTPMLPPTRAAASTAKATLRGERDGPCGEAEAVNGADVIPAAVGVGRSGEAATVGRVAASRNVCSSGARRVLIPAA